MEFCLATLYDWLTRIMVIETEAVKPSTLPPPLVKLSLERFLEEKYYAGDVVNVKIGSRPWYVLHSVLERPRCRKLGIPA